MSYATEQSVLNAQWNAAHASELTELERQRPFVLLRPELYADGDKWCALYGPNIQIGVCAFGDTPEAAARQFDIEWLNAHPPRRKYKPPYPFCHTPKECDGLGACPKELACND